MPRLPQPGSDAGNWGDLLNDFLSTTHDTNGNLKTGSVNSAAIASDSVTLAKLATSNAPTSGQVLSYDGSNLSWAASSGSGSTPDASASVKGVVQLAGDLSGTASAPTVPGLAAKANTADVVALAGAQTVTGAKNFTGGLQSAGAAVVTTGDARLTDARTPIDTSVTTAKIADNAITEPKLSAANIPTSGQILSFNGTNFTWVAQPTGTATDPTMGGSLTGTASNAQLVPNAITATELASNAVTTVKITDANVTTAKIADNAVTEPKLAASNTPTTGQVLSYNGTTLAWATPATGSGDPTLGGDLTGTASAAQIASGAVGTTELASNAVTTVKITDANVTTAKIADANVTSAKIADNSVTEPKLSVSNTPTTGQVLSYNGAALAWATPATGGGSTWTAVVRSSAYTAVSSNFVICDTTTSGFTVTLPAPTNGAYVTVKKSTNNVNAVLVAPPSGTIDAGSATSATIAVNSYGQVADFLADGTTWHQVG